MEHIQIINIYAYILNHEGKLLIVQRALTDSMPGIWELPGGGLEFGETPRTGVQREVMEECGLAVIVESPIHVTSHVSEKSGTMRQIIRVVYECTLSKESAPVVLSADHMAYRWVDPMNLPDVPLSEFLQDTLLHLKNLKRLQR